MRAERAEAAQLAVAAAVKPIKRDVQMYGAGRKSDMRRDDHVQTQDMESAADILAAADGLPKWRLWLVRRRVRGIYGKTLTEIAETYPSPKGRTMGALLAPMLVTHYRGVNEGKPPKMLDGLMHRALSTDPEARTVRRLVRQLSRLARCL